MKITILLCFICLVHLVNAEPNYFPLNTSNTWTYQSTFLISTTTYTESILGTEMCGDESYFAFDNFRVATSVVLRGEDQKVYTYIDETKYLLYDFSAEVGASWTAPDPPNTIMGRMRLSSKTDSVSTPMGTFTNCYHFNHQIDGSNYYDEWFAPDVGIVKRNTRLMGGAIDAVLVEYNIKTRVYAKTAVKHPGYALSPGYPNPFNASTVIRFSIPRNTRVNVTIYDALGRFVENLVDAHLPAGTHSVEWNAINRSSGQYIATMTADNFTEMIKLSLVK